MVFMQGDVVRYVGKRALKNETKRGEVLAPMGNEPGVYVVEFGDDAYVMPEASLRTYVATQQELETATKEPEVVQKKKRRRQSDDEV
jgi:hypothetical protein